MLIDYWVRQLIVELGLCNRSKLRQGMIPLALVRVLNCDECVYI